MPTPAQAESISPLTVEYSTSTAPLIINAFAARYGADFYDLLAVAKCESGLDANAKGDYKNGKPTSFGIFQIHLPSHPEVTRAQALDPWFSIEWSAKHFAAGNQNMWTCYRMLKSAKPPLNRE